MGGIPLAVFGPTVCVRRNRAYGGWGGFTYLPDEEGTWAEDSAMPGLGWGSYLGKGCNIK